MGIASRGKPWCFQRAHSKVSFRPSRGNRSRLGRTDVTSTLFAKSLETLAAGRMKAVLRLLDPNARPKSPSGFCALAVMTKAPQPGRVKTRLVPPLTPNEAATLNACFLRDTTVAISSAIVSGGLLGKACGVAVYAPVGWEGGYADILP